MTEDAGAAEIHVPVLLEPVLEGLRISTDGFYVDGTFGRGGHSRAILQKLGSDGRLLAIDRDPRAVAAADPDLCRDPRFELIRGEIAELESIMDARGLLGSVAGLLLDLGVSSPQLDDPAGGFSFRLDGPLDMRMDPDSGVSAAAWLAHVDERELSQVIARYGEEKFARRIARAIVSARATQSVERTRQLADLVVAAVPAPRGRIHPATRTFQAIRMYINRELEQLERALRATPGVLAQGGRLCVISFHSLEDRCVKHFLRDLSREAEQYRGLPDVPADARPKFRMLGRAHKPSAAEIGANPRARSARLRIAERL